MATLLLQDGFIRYLHTNVTSHARFSRFSYEVPVPMYLWDAEQHVSEYKSDQRQRDAAKDRSECICTNLLNEAT
jgi:hypothetical protein